MSKCDLRIEFDRKDRRYSGGETVTGRVYIRVNESVKSNGITLTHQWRTHGRGNVTSGPKAETELEAVRSYSPGEEHELSFSVPSPTHPVTYHGTMINVDHYVSVQMNVPWAFNPRAEEEYVLVPGEPPAHFVRKQKCDHCADASSWQILDRGQSRAGYHRRSLADGRRGVCDRFASRHSADCRIRLVSQEGAGQSPGRSEAFDASRCCGPWRTMDRTNPVSASKAVSHQQHWTDTAGKGIRHIRQRHEGHHPYAPDSGTKDSRSCQRHADGRRTGIRRIHVCVPVNGRLQPRAVGQQNSMDGRRAH